MIHDPYTYTMEKLADLTCDLLVEQRRAYREGDDEQAKEVERIRQAVWGARDRLDPKRQFESTR